MDISIKDLLYNKIKLPTDINSDIRLAPGEVSIGKNFVKIGLLSDNEEDIQAGNNVVSIPLEGKTIDEKEYTYQELKELKDSKALIPGARYILTDYYTQYYQPFGGRKEQGNIDIGEGAAYSLLKVGEADYSEDLDFSKYYEKICLMAVSPSSFSPNAYSVKYPDDLLVYNFDNNEDTYGVNKPGFITRRIDTVNNIDLPYDWRAIKFARWEYDLTEINGCIYATLKEGELDSGKGVDVKVQVGQTIYKDNLYVYPCNGSNYFIACINDCIFNGIESDPVTGITKVYDDFVYFKDIYAFDSDNAPIYINKDKKYCFKTSNKKEFFTFEGEGNFFNIKMEGSTELPNNVFITTNEADEVSNCYFGYNNNNNTFYASMISNITTKNNFQNNLLYDSYNCSFENDTYNSIFYNFNNNKCFNNVSYSIYVDKDGYFDGVTRGNPAGYLTKEDIDEYTKSIKVIVVDTVEDNKIVLNNNYDFHLEELDLTELTLDLPEKVLIDYFCALTIQSGETPINIISNDITWKGIDCNTNNEFTPVKNTIYEISFRRVYDSENDVRKIVARVGAI